MNKVIIASDSFKGSLSSYEVAEAAEQAIIQVSPECNIVKVITADGGEGSIDAIRHTVKTKTVRIKSVDPLYREIETEYIITGDDKAVIELAAASGITRLEKEELNPMITSTYGTGILVMDAIRRGCRDIILTLGGSATNDGGTGILCALGAVFKDKNGNAVTCNGKGLNNIESIDLSGISPEVKATKFTLACDVTNPMFGKDGAAYVFARQKGADTESIEKLDEGLRNLNKAFVRLNGRDISMIPGTGAAGGTAGGLVAILGAHIIPGAELLLEMADFDNMIKGADLVITGEGRIDMQTLNGKLPYTVACHARTAGIPVLALCGICAQEMKNRRNLPFEIVEVSPHDIPSEEAMKKDNARKFIISAIKNYLSGRGQ